MSTTGQPGGGGGPRWRRLLDRLPRPTGIRNGGLLLVLVALAAVVALVDKPPEPEGARRLPGVFQYLPPPVGIFQLPPTEAPTPPAADGPGAAATAVAAAERRSSADRAHPRREHPRPDRSAASTRSPDAVRRPVGGGDGTGGAPVTRPPVTTPPVAAAPAASVRVPPAQVRVTPPAVRGRELPEVRVQTPEVRVDVPAGSTAVP